MGLLTDPKQRQRLVAIISKYNQKLSILLYIVGLAWFFLLAYQPLNASTYFSENALLPGLVENEFYNEAELSNFNKQLMEELKKDDKTTPKDWVYEQFQSFGLDVYSQNFSLKYPFGQVDKEIPGRNVYAILRARRSSSTESVVISAPLRPWLAEDEQTSGGIAIMMALARHFRNKPYIAKDIIFLMPEYDEVGMQAWLDGYHGTTSNFIFPGRLPGRSGQIQAALNLEIPPEKTAYLNIKLEGINGQLPNLDFVNLVVRLCRKERVKVTLNKMDDYIYDPETFEGYTHALKTMLNMMWYQAPGSPTGNHGLFHRFHIEALTLSGEPEKRGRNVGLDKSGRIVEGVFRSLNNLLERFHQSFFFYILSGTQRYISIGIYMPPFALMVAAGLIKALALWIGADSSQKKTEEDSGAVKDEDKDGEKDGDKDEDKDGEKDGDKDEDKDGEKDEDKDGEKSGEEKAEKKKEGQKDSEQKRKEKSEKLEKEKRKLDEDEEEDDGDIGDEAEIPQQVGLRSLLPVASICMLLGFLAYSGPNVMSQFSTPFRLRVQDSLMFGLLALFCASLLYPRMIKKKYNESDKFQVDWQTLKSVSLILLSLILFAIALMNISLAFFLTATMMPVCTFVVPTSSRIMTWLQKLLLLLVSPRIVPLHQRHHLHHCTRGQVQWLPGPADVVVDVREAECVDEAAGPVFLWKLDLHSDESYHLPQLADVLGGASLRALGVQGVSV
ncbi:LOW QUALITY PROTEIN: glycosylphosphatidylinositol anchor attachment 1 protein-like [Haliotis rubra]|uniref:LOW QUALITY PROTEIN: glycosylphosphatidylinositol anchor attachment 1 protein-like n=1 Tax=Haliotis rubra TaxID=36100 RepID=UPI001EE53F39|nr:LOW QUALITY PROTEIN: glycosylphosphatidylinositol anchor attachment 1 protein-like [Haliotis rubra]